MSSSFGQAAPCVIPLSGAGYAALASVRVEGCAGMALIGQFFHPASSLSWSACEVGDLVFGHWGQPDGEEVIVSRLASDAAEVHCHGGLVSRDQLIASLLAAGCHLVQWNDWIVEQPTDRIATLAKIALTEAKTKKVAMILIDQLQGSLRDTVATIVKQLEQGRNREAITDLENLLALAPLGLHLKSGWRVVFFGFSNVGKSSLINAVLGYERSIVLSHPGTTRDVILATTALDGWPIELVDTAGLRIKGDALEEAGMQLAVQEAARADLVLLVSDASQAWTRQEDRWLQQFPHAVVVHNKWDLAEGQQNERPSGLKTVAVASTGVDALCEKIVQRCIGVAPQSHAAVPFTRGQVEILELAHQSLRDGASERAASLLRCELLGEREPHPKNA